MGSVENPKDAATAFISKFKSKRNGTPPDATVTKLNPFANLDVLRNRGDYENFINEYRGQPRKVVTPTTPVRRKLANIPKTWAKIPHHRGLKLAKEVGDPVLAVLLALQIEVHNAKSNRVKLTNDILGRYEITHQSKARGLRLLEAAGVVSVEWGNSNGRKMAPMVTHHWYTEDGEFIELDGASAPS